MKIYWVLTLALIILLSCMAQQNPISQSETDLSGCNTSFDNQSENNGEYVPWGYYQLEIARDGSYGEMIPLRSADYYTYGHHINALKLLEGGPGTNCVWISNIHPTIEGYVSVDVSIKHPFNNAAYTGFDVRGIIMFPAHQYVYDDELREQAGFPPWPKFECRFSSAEKGDAELVNGEGWTLFWAPPTEFGWQYEVYIETGFPIFEYYEGNFASGEEIGTLNPFIRFHSTETRHMFEAGKTVTRTYIIKPPAVGPIEAEYAVYAHWAEPDVIPVMDPETDFPLIANSAMPYELEIHQDGIIDPDAPGDVNGEKIHIHFKDWGVIPFDNWGVSMQEFIGSSWVGGSLIPHPSGEPDLYCIDEFYDGYYSYLPDPYPGTWPFIIRIRQRDPDPFGIGMVGVDMIILDVEFGALDGVW